MITLFHAPQSRSSRLIWLLEEIGEPYEIKYVSIRRQDGSGAIDPENPHPDGKAPALRHDGTLITESAAIALYLTDAFPRAGVGAPVGDPLRADYVRWLFYYAGVIEPLMFVKFAQGPVGIDATRAWGSQEVMEKSILDALGRGPFILGDRFTAVDVLIGSMGRWARAMLPPDAVVDSYLARVGARPALIAAAKKDAVPA